MAELAGQLMFGEAAEIIQAAQEEQYQAFEDKFKMAKTTDECYTPPEIYDGIAEWVSAEYGIDRREFLRPFWPGEDYRKEEYPDGCAVVDNPPFSILSQIITFYLENNVKFFLFGPTLTILQQLQRPERRGRLCVLLVGTKLVYENGAEVNTSYITNMDRYASVS